MALDLRDCSFFGPALPEPFVKYQLEKHLKKLKLLQKHTGDEGKALRESWDVYRRKLRMLGDQGGERRVANHVFEPLVQRLGYEGMERQKIDSVLTREGPEDGGYLMTSTEDSKLRCWSVAVGTDLDAPNRRGRAYRFSPSRIAQRVLLAQGERVGLLTNGEELRLLICDPARPDSHIAVALDRSGGWRRASRPPDSYRLLLALATPAGADAVPELTDEARLAQSTVTDKLRVQARRAVEGFVQVLLDHPQNADAIGNWEDIEVQAKQLWREGLILVYRLLFIFKLESSADPARAFSFATTALWRDTYSPNVALADLVRRLIDEGAQTGVMLEEGLRTLFRMFAEGMQSSELNIRPLGGMLFGQDAIPLIDALHWGEEAVARLLDHLLWTPGDKKTERERVHYGTLDVEDMGRVYEALLELEPGISTEPMCRLKRAKLEVVVPAAQGEPYRAKEGAKKSGKTKVEWIEEIPSGRFYLRVGLGRKASGSYYTPHPFVRFLVQETLGPQVEERSPKVDPQPGRLLELTVLDPAMGSGHFLVEACRYLGDALYEACRLCDELAVESEEESESAEEPQHAELLARAQEFWKRVEDLPDPEDELLAYLPSRVAEGEESGLSQQKAEAMCRRLVAVHCLYGVDKNPMAVELAKLSLWLESYAEGLPLTFLDHRLICGDSLTGPFFEHLLTYPGSGEKLDDLFSQGLSQRLTETLEQAMSYVTDLEASVGKDVADLEQKRIAKQKLDDALEPFKVLAAAWSGGVMLGDESSDVRYASFARAISERGLLVSTAEEQEKVAQGISRDGQGVSFELAFPEVFLRDSQRAGNGFDAIIGNPPWERVLPDRREFVAPHNPEALTAPSSAIPEMHEQLTQSSPPLSTAWQRLNALMTGEKRVHNALASCIPKADAKSGSAAALEYAFLFTDRVWRLCSHAGSWGLILPGGFHTNLSSSLLRQMLLEQKWLSAILGFSNRRKLFDISPGMRFDLVIGKPNSCSVASIFGLEDPAMLFESLETVALDNDRLQQISGPSLAIPEVGGETELELLETAAKCPQSIGMWARERSSQMGEELNSTRKSHLFLEHCETVETGPPSSSLRAVWPLHEKGTISQYSDRNKQQTRYCVEVSQLLEEGVKLEPARYYRLAHRKAIHAQEELKVVFALLPPCVQVADSALPERNPHSYPVCDALWLMAIANSFSVNALARPRVGLNLLKHNRETIPLPAAPTARALLVHHALRLSCNHQGFQDLWDGELRRVWHEPKPLNTWPVLETEDERWAVRAVIDAVVADAYGLNRSQYEHILSTFSHKSYPKAPELCLAAFDELKAIGLEAFTKKHDPYWDIPLNEELPKPVIDLPIPSDSADQVREGTLPLYGASEPEQEDE